MSRAVRFAIAAAAVLTATAAIAGYRVYTPVTIYRDAAGKPLGVYGAIGSARSSPDAAQYIGCQVSGWLSLTTPYVSCSARDTGGTTVYCHTTDPRLIQVALGAAGDAYLAFEWDANGVCTYLNVRDYSMYEPRQ